MGYATRSPHQAALLAFLIAGCGGGSAPPSTSTSVDPPPPSDSSDSTGAPRPECGAPRPVDGEEVPAAERGFRPIRPSEAAGLVGKSVFAATHEGPGDRVLIVAGEPVTLCGPPGPGDAPAVSVMNNAGQEVTVPLSHLSSSPLRFNLRRPGSAPVLLEAALAEADALGRRLREIDPADAASAEGARAALTDVSDIARSLIVGGASEASLRDRDGWVARAEDPSILEGHVHGLRDAADRKRFEGVEACLTRLADATISPAPTCSPPP